MYAALSYELAACARSPAGWWGSRSRLFNSRACWHLRWVGMSHASAPTFELNCARLSARLMHYGMFALLEFDRKEGGPRCGSCCLRTWQRRWWAAIAPVCCAGHGFAAGVVQTLTLARAQVFAHLRCAGARPACGPLPALWAGLAKLWGIQPDGHMQDRVPAVAGVLKEGVG